MIRSYIEYGKLGIRPLSPETIRENGVDLRFSDAFQPLKKTDAIYDTHLPSAEQNPLFFDPIIHADYYDLQPGYAVQIATMEWIDMPVDLCAVINLRSTYARLMTLGSPTAINAGWHGNVVYTLQSPYPYGVRLYKGDRFMHVLFDSLTSPAEKPYDKDGKYQDQQGMVGPKMDVEKTTRRIRVPAIPEKTP
jgi:dCTP deaminase